MGRSVARQRCGKTLNEQRGRGRRERTLEAEKKEETKGGRTRAEIDI